MSSDDPTSFAFPFETLELGIAYLRPRRRDAARCHQRILAAARDLFTTLGVDRVTMHQIGRAAGVGQGTLYRHFPQKRTICAVLLIDRFTLLRAAIISALTPSLHPALPALPTLPTLPTLPAFPDALLTMPAALTMPTDMPTDMPTAPIAPSPATPDTPAPSAPSAAPASDARAASPSPAPSSSPLPPRHPLEDLFRAIAQIAIFNDDIAPLRPTLLADPTITRLLPVFGGPLYTWLRTVFIATIQHAILLGHLPGLDIECLADTLLAALAPDAYLYRRQTLGHTRDRIVNALCDLLTSLSLVSPATPP